MSRRLLVLDDDAAIVAVVRRYFEARGFVVEACFDAESALAQVASEAQYDAVLCDLHFTPARLSEGLEIVARARERHPEATVLLFTGAPEAGTRELALARGADALVTKPTPLAALHEAVLTARRGA